MESWSDMSEGVCVCRVRRPEKPGVEGGDQEHERGQEYHTANGAKLVNQGQRRIKAVTEEGVAVQRTYQVSDVTKPLNAVSKIFDQENVVFFQTAVIL